MLEKYEQELHDLGEKAEQQHSVARYNRCIVDAAVRTELATMDDDTPEDLADVPVWQIRQWSIEIVAHIAAAKAPPDPN